MEDRHGLEKSRENARQVAPATSTQIRGADTRQAEYCTPPSPVCDSPGLITSADPNPPCPHAGHWLRNIADHIGLRVRSRREHGASNCRWIDKAARQRAIFGDLNRLSRHECRPGIGIRSAQHCPACGAQAIRFEDAANAVGQGAALIAQRICPPRTPGVHQLGQ